MKEKIKKISLFIIIFLFSFDFLSSVKATSGACSWHGGVNCAVGPDWDGSVICNDGWKDSGVSFYSTDECFSTDVYCTTSELESLRQKYGVPKILAEIDSIMQEIDDLEAQADAMEEYTPERTYLFSKIESLALEAQQKQYTLGLINDQIDTECSALGYDRQQQDYLEQQKFLMEKQQNELESQQTELEELLKQLKALSCPANSTYRDGSCFCNNGYVAKGSICITYTQNCQNQYGINSYGDKNYCYCKSGYEWNSSKTTCVKSIVCPLNSTKTNNICVCNNGYEWNTDKTVCLKIETPHQTTETNQNIAESQNETTASPNEKQIEEKQVTQKDDISYNENTEKNKDVSKKTRSGLTGFFSNLLASISNAFKNLFSKVFR